MAFLSSARGIFGRVFGKSNVVEQVLLWQVAGQVIGTLMQPGLTELSKLINSEFQTVPLSPAELAEMVIKGHLSQGAGADLARESGISPSDFQRLVDVGGESPGLDFLLEAFRRGFIQQAGGGADATSLEQGIRESRLKNKWIPVVERMGLRPIPLADAIDAWVESQITPELAQEIAYQNGISKDDAVILFNTRGNPPTPSELIELVRRGIVPMKGTGPDVTSLQQGIFEGATKNKWEPGFEALIEAVPPPRTVTALLRSGSITDAQAARWFQDAGLSAEAAAAYVANAHHGRTATQKELTVSTITDLYEQRVIPAADATTALQHLGYSAQDAAFVLALKDLQREIKAVSSTTGRIGKLYIARKIDRPAVVAVLNTLHIPDAQVTELLTVWDQERALDVKTLTEGQVVAAFHYGIFDQATAQAELETLGYTASDAWALLSIRQRGPIPGRPA